MMTRWILRAALALALSAGPALAQMGVPTHGIPVSRGQGSGAFKSVGPCDTGVPIVGAGLTSDPICGAVSGITLANVQPPTRLATAAVLPNTPSYSNGALGVGATLTAGSMTTLTVDGVVAALNDVILVKNQAAPEQNGIYTVTTAGSGGAAWVLTRATYFDIAAEMIAGSNTLVTAGTVNANYSFILATAVTTVGTDPLIWYAFSTQNLSLSNGRVYVGNASGVAIGVAMSGDCTIVAAGIITCTKSNGVAFGTLAFESVACPAGYFCVPDTYATIADAVTALNMAGGGVLYITQSQTLAAAQTIGDNTNVMCSNKGVRISTTSTTADMFLISGTFSTISNCKLAYTGVGTKTAGALVHQTGDTIWLSDLVVDGGCYACFNLNGLVTYMSNVAMSGNVTETVAATSAAIRIGIISQIVHMNNITLAPSAAGHFYEYGLDVQGSAIDATNIELIQANYVVNMQGSGFLLMSNGYLDNCGVQCIRLAPNASTVSLKMTNMHIGLNNAGAVINIDSTLGSIAEVAISNSSIFNYSASTGNCISILGPQNNVSFVGNIVTSCNTAFLINGGVTGGITAMSNLLQGSSFGILATPLNTNTQIIFNRLGGSTQNCGLNAAANCGNNLP